MARPTRFGLHPVSLTPLRSEGEDFQSRLSTKCEIPVKQRVLTDLARPRYQRSRKRPARRPEALRTVSQPDCPLPGAPLIKRGFIASTSTPRLLGAGYIDGYTGKHAFQKLC